MAAADDAFMGALEEAERELKATGGDAGISSSAQTPATDAAEEAGVTNSLPDGSAGDEPYAASDDEPAVSPTVGNEAPSTSHAKVERSGRGSDRHRSSANAEGRSAFKARVVKEVKLALRAFYLAGRITSKEDFKELASDLTHKILSKDPKKTTWDDKMPGRVQKNVDVLFAKDFVYDPSRRKPVK